jgi:hypothetical protein
MPRKTELMKCKLLIKTFIYPFYKHHFFNFEKPRNRDGFAGILFAFLMGMALMKGNS